MADLLQKQFAITGAEISSLEGYDSVNFKIKTAKGSFVLKQYVNDQANKELLQAENETLNALALIKGYDFPEAFANKDGRKLVEQDDALFRLLSFVEGEFLADVAHTPALLNSFGRFLAEMDSVLMKFHNSAISAKKIPWDLNHFNQSYKYLEYIGDPRDRSLVDYFFLQYEEQIRPIQHKLRTSIIHNDANDWNVLTKSGKVSGIIDLGDMADTWLINELAVALTYVMMNKEDPIQVGKEVVAAYHEILPLKNQELDILYYLIAARLCTSVCNSAYTKTLKPDSEYITISEQPAWKLLRQLLAINPLSASAQFKSAAKLKSAKRSQPEVQLKRRDTFLSKALSLSYERPIEMHRSAFQYMYDTEHNAILDAYNNIMITGHCHPTVVRAGQRAMAKLNTNTRYIYEEILSYSEKLLGKFPSKLNKVFFVNSGSAASDLALRLAQAYTGKTKIMSLEHGYHGNTRMGIGVSHYKYSHKKGVGQPSGTIATPLPKVFGSGYENDGSAGEHFAAAALSTIEANKNEIAAFIAEPIVGCGGQVPLAKGYLNSVYPAIRSQGGVCISDEVQVGFGRLGDYFWGFEMYHVVPDIVVLGKPMGNGHPIGAVVTTSDIAAAFESGPEFFSSFGGNPVSCAIGEAVLKVIEDEHLQEHALLVGNYLKKLLENLQAEYPQLADIRGSGLFLGVELLDNSGSPNTALAAHIKNSLREQNILVSTDGPFDSVIKIKPPLAFRMDDAATLVNAIAKILKGVGK
ncbi:aminotransferase class III-fold pyridoxal phosphate-dependent enzyme [Muriicola sp. Z0-33]|nr:aminotransferase class III-fold pyridoxal phosphate-dependent enzyme [Muriicola sp. Z0-33]